MKSAHAISAPPSRRGSEAAADWSNLKSPRTYTGYSRTERCASPGGIIQSIYTAPARSGDNQWALEGDWTITEQAARSNVGKTRVLYRFHARGSAHLVMGPPMDSPVRIRVRIDGKPPGSLHSPSLSPHARRERSPERTSSVKISGCSQAAKCPPFATLL